ncbi:MAG: multicopper oxidase family protein [Burkholderiales bacterium]
MATKKSTTNVDVGKRDLLKMTAATAASVAAVSVITTKKSQAQPVPTILVQPSPATTPWLEALPVMPKKETVSTLSPTPARTRVTGEVGRAAHQAWANFKPKKYYEVRIQERDHSFHPELPKQKIWGYDGTFPGPTFHAKYGEPMLVRFRNELPPNAAGPGSPEISVHLHNLHTPSESDGFPMDYFSPTKAGPGLTPGAFKDHHYPMVYAGLDTFGGIGDPREALGTMWYHDHRVEFTSPNVYRGLCGFFLAFDAIDSGNENDTNPLALKLPSGEYDVPLVLNNVHFDAQGRLFFDQFGNDGFIGDKTAINGKILPYFNVARRKYRFRFLDGSVARFYDLQVRYKGFVQPLTYIANDGNLIQAPLNRSNVRIAPAERADVVVDFSRYPIGAELFLVNRLIHEDGRQPKDGKFLEPPTPILKFVVDRNPPAPDVSRVPSILRLLPPVDLTEVVNTRHFDFDRSGGMWTINERLFDNTPQAAPRKGTAEIWVLKNQNDGWQHPVHIHFEEGRILSRNGVPPPVHERGRKDVYVVGENEEVQVFIRFRDFLGKYVMHCHNLTHEDHGMMMRFDVV